MKKKNKQFLQKNVTTTESTLLAWTHAKLRLWFSQFTNITFGLTSRIFCSTPPLTPAITVALIYVWPRQSMMEILSCSNFYRILFTKLPASFLSIRKNLRNTSFILTFLFSSIYTYITQNF